MLDRPATFSQLFQQQVPVIALNFNNTAFYGTSCTKLCFEFFTEFLEPRFIKGNTGNYCHTFPLASLRFSSNSHNAIALRNHFLLMT